MVRSLLLTILPCFFAILACGCEAPPSATEPTQRRVWISDRDGFFNDALTLLREKDFPPRRVDRTEGVAVAGPTTSGQWFEFWRSDSQGSYQTLESSMHTIRRTVTVRLAADGPAGGSNQGQAYQLSVQVDKERYSAPERQLTTPLGALAIYSDKLPTEEGLRAARTYGEHWVPIGRDALLEEFLLNQIAERTGASLSGVGTESPPTTQAAPAMRPSPPVPNRPQPASPAPAATPTTGGGLIIRDVQPSP